ncbi:MAG TPA: hypothetical protein VGI92_06015 [Gemmatimonadales bacterium]|jgi:hypothetical protein
MFNRLRDALERALASATPPPDLGAIASQMREAVIEQKTGVRAMQDDLAKATTLLQHQRDELATAGRRREQAASINDAETIEIADKYIARLTERVGVLERKVAAQQEELGLAERDLAEMTAQLSEAVKRHPGVTSERSTDAAWRELGKGGMDRPEVDVEGELLQGRMERAAREAAADARLDELKKRMGRE